MNLHQFAQSLLRQARRLKSVTRVTSSSVERMLVIHAYMNDGAVYEVRIVEQREARQ